MTLKNKRAPLPCYFQLCASFRSHWWIQTGVTLWKRPSWVMTYVTWTFNLWPWHFAWTSLLWFVITHENFVIIRWERHSERDVTDRQIDRRTDKQTDKNRCSLKKTNSGQYQYSHWLFTRWFHSLVFCRLIADHRNFNNRWFLLTVCRVRVTNPRYSCNVILLYITNTDQQKQCSLSHQH